MRTLSVLLLALAACATPAPPAADHAACERGLRESRASFLRERIVLLDELVTSYQARFDAEPVLEKKREVFALQEKAVRRMLATRNELLAAER